jgi:hypothetical protein
MPPLPMMMTLSLAIAMFSREFNSQPLFIVPAVPRATAFRGELIAHADSRK